MSSKGSSTLSARKKKKDSKLKQTNLLDNHLNQNEETTTNTGSEILKETELNEENNHKQEEEIKGGSTIQSKSSVGPPNLQMKVEEKSNLNSKKKNQKKEILEHISSQFSSIQQIFQILIGLVAMSYVIYFYYSLISNRGADRLISYYKLYM